MNDAASFPIPSDRSFSISDFNRGKASSIFRLADREPVYVIMDLDEYRRMCEELEDERDRRLAMERLEKNEGKPTIGMNDVMAQLGITQEDIDNTPEVAIE